MNGVDQETTVNVLMTPCKIYVQEMDEKIHTLEVPASRLEVYACESHFRIGMSLLSIHPTTIVGFQG